MSSTENKENKEKKIALLIGINYTNTENKLYGCHNDVDKYNQVLINNFRYNEDDIIILKDLPNMLQLQPTYKNIIDSLKSMANRSKSNEEKISEVTIYYSGHGSSIVDTVVDQDKDEEDGKDECIIPSDYNYKKDNVIIDDDINLLLSKFNESTKIICIFDCCRSGSCTDLSYSFSNNILVKSVSKNEKIMKNKNIFALSSCKDDQVTIEMNNTGGVLTNALITTLEEYRYNCTVKQLLEGINNVYKKNKINQNSILSVSSESCDQNTKIFDIDIQLSNKDKIALLIGINYTNTSCQLNGCHNDIDKYKQVLINNFRYDKDNITILKDLPNMLQPTSNNIIKSFQNMANRSKSKEEKISEVTIYYSGHGSYIKDIDGDEADGKDECIVPLDYNNGYITDDLIHKLLRMFNTNTKIICIFDCCHSGSCTDLPYSFSYNTKLIKSVSKNEKIMENKNIFALSGCKDEQVSLESYDIYNRVGGLLTNALIATLKENKYNCTVEQLLAGINKKLKGTEQIPILSVSSESCDKNTNIFNTNIQSSNEDNLNKDKSNEDNSIEDYSIEDDSNGDDSIEDDSIGDYSIEDDSNGDDSIEDDSNEYTNIINSFFYDLFDFFFKKKQ